MVANPTLSIVLPVHNAEQTLTGRIAQLLDIVPDLTTDFEVLVINDGSTDHTEEVAYELAREYPQIRVTRHAMRRGRRGAIETGMAQTTGDILIVQDEQGAIDSSKLHRLWELRNDEELVLNQPSLRLQQALLQRLAAWGVRLEDTTPGGDSCGVQMIRRRNVNQREATSAGTPGRSPRHLRSDSADAPRASRRSSRRVVS